MEELTIAKKDYEKALEEGSITRLNDILDHLKDVKVTLSMLKQTGMVACLKKIKHSTNEDIKNDSELQKKCTTLISKWKKDVTEIMKRESTDKVESPRETSPLSQESPHSESVSTPTVCEAAKEKKAELSKSEINKLLNPADMNATRVKFRNLLYNDLNDKIASMNCTESQLVRCIVDVETALNSHYNSVGTIEKEYRTHFRDIRYNLKQNKRLLGDLLYGEITGDRLAVMTSEEMLTDEVKKEREQMKEELFEAYQTDWYKKHMKMAGGFKCRRCGSDKTQYYQKQTRSADEPMTVFFECLNCGKRWRE